MPRTFFFSDYSDPQFLMLPHRDDPPEQPSPFLTQTLPSKRLEITNRLFIVIFSSLSLAYGVFGVVLVFSREEGTEYSSSYGEECHVGSTCIIKIEISRDMSHPIAVMYELTGFYQNHLRSMTSRSDRQLLGEYVRFDEMSDCSPLRSVDDDPSPNKWILPCGLQANTMFNDTFSIRDFRPLNAPGYPETGVAVNPLNAMYQAGIKWLESKDEYLTDQLNLRFALWMDTAAFSRFRRVWGTTTEVGLVHRDVLEIEVHSNYDVSSFDGEKAVVLASMSTFPRSARLLGTFYLIAAAIMLISSTFVVIMKRQQNRPE
jgi:hypothetical protein